MNAENGTYLDSFGVEHIPKEIKKFLGNKNFINIYKIQVCNSIMCGYYLMDLLISCWKVKVC